MVDLSNFMTTAEEEQALKDEIGRLKTDPLSEQQRRKIFVLGGKLGLKKDDIKAEYDIDSISNLTSEEANALIEQMIKDNGGDDDYDATDLSRFRGSFFSTKRWEEVSGIHTLNGAMACCCECFHFKVSSKKLEGTCGLGIKTGVFKGEKTYPLSKNCFKYFREEVEKHVMIDFVHDDSDDDCPF